MNVLFRCLTKRHFFLMFLILAIGVSLFVVIDFFEKITVFIESESNISTVFLYFFYKLPGIIAQILPAIFLLATIILLCFMISSRELITLNAGGISLFSVVKVLLFSAIFWTIAQLVLSQVITPKGVQESERIWIEDIKKNNLDTHTIHNIWFLEDPYIINLSTLEKSGNGTGFLAYKMSQEWNEIEEIIRAETFFAKENEWTIQKVQKFNVRRFSTDILGSFSFSISQNPNSFFITYRDNPQSLALGELGKTIKNLETAGSNIEALSTIWHSKIAYATTTIVMLFVAVAIVIWKSNIYLAISISIPMIFLTYTMTIFFDSLGYTGALPPIMAAWFSNIGMLSFCFIWLLYMNRQS